MLFFFKTVLHSLCNLKKCFSIFFFLLFTRTAVIVFFLYGIILMSVVAWLLYAGFDWGIFNRASEFLHIFTGI